MKCDRIVLKPNTDGSFQVEVCGQEYGKEKTYSAKDLSEAFDKAKAGLEEMKSEKPSKKEKKNSIPEFMGMNESCDD
jgi:cobyric acid synthase